MVAHRGRGGARGTRWADPRDSGGGDAAGKSASAAPQLASRARLRTGGGRGNASALLRCGPAASRGRRAPHPVHRSGAAGRARLAARRARALRRRRGCRCECGRSDPRRRSVRLRRDHGWARHRARACGRRVPGGLLRDLCSADARAPAAGARQRGSAGGGSGDRSGRCDRPAVAHRLIGADRARRRDTAVVAAHARGRRRRHSRRLLAQLAGSRRLGSRLASFAGLTEVVFAAALAWLLLAEVPGPLQLVGGACILAGVVLVRWGGPDAGATTRRARTLDRVPVESEP